MLQVSMPSIGEDESEAVRQVLDSGWISSGRKVEQFEAAVATAHGHRFGVACNSGGSALHLALCALGVEPGDEVIVPAITMIAVVNAVLMCGAKPVIADAVDDFGNLGSETVMPLLGDRTKVVIAAHAYGEPTPRMKRLVKDITPAVLVEDCSEAHYASQDGCMVGSFGSLSTFSFYANKIITCGEGGMVIGREELWEDSLRSLRHHGFGKDRYLHTGLAFSYRMTEMQAAIGLTQHLRSESLLLGRRQVRSWYEELLPEGIVPTLSEGGVPWMMPVLLDGRDELKSHLARCGVDSRCYFTPMGRQPQVVDRRATPRADSLHERGLCLPLYPAMSKIDVEKVAEAIREFYA